MAHKYTSKEQTDIFVNDFGVELEFEKVFSESDFIGKESFLDFLINEKYVVKTLDTKPGMSKGIVNYENVSYPKERFVIKDGSIYESKQKTSSGWLVSEWNMRVKGTID